MIKFAIILTTTLLAFVMLMGNVTHKFNKEAYLDEKVLDMARPLDVNIDVEFLKKLNPAYEQQ